MPRMTAVINERLRSLVALADLQQLGLQGVGLAEVSAEAALTFMQLEHVTPPWKRTGGNCQSLT